jgi:uncharacterized phage infection (PIP) family protein YhgE
VGAGSQLVASAGQQMNGIVASVQRFGEIMNEIATATQEQGSGIEQINTAIVQMDQVTQQNAALVEEASAAAQSLSQQASGLLKVVSIFKIRQDASVTTRQWPGRHAAPGLPGRAAGSPALRLALTRQAWRPAWAGPACAQAEGPSSSSSSLGTNTMPVLAL